MFIKKLRTYVKMYRYIPILLSRPPFRFSGFGIVLRMARGTDPLLKMSSETSLHYTYIRILVLLNKASETLLYAIILHIEG